MDLTADRDYDYNKDEDDDNFISDGSMAETVSSGEAVDEETFCAQIKNRARRQQRQTKCISKINNALVCGQGSPIRD